MHLCTNPLLFTQPHLQSITPIPSRKRVQLPTPRRLQLSLPSPTTLLLNHLIHINQHSPRIINQSSSQQLPGSRMHSLNSSLPQSQFPAKSRSSRAQGHSWSRPHLYKPLQWYEANCWFLFFFFKYFILFANKFYHLRTVVLGFKWWILRQLSAAKIR